MKSIRENIDAVQAAYDDLKAHCMCRAVRDEGIAFIVIYPDGDWPGGKDGLRCGYGIRSGEGKEWALRRLIERMEQDWLNSFPSPIKRDGVKL